MIELQLRRSMCLTPHAFDIVRKAWQRDMRSRAVRRDARGRFSTQENMNV